MSKNVARLKIYARYAQITPIKLQRNWSVKKISYTVITNKNHNKKKNSLKYLTVFTPLDFYAFNFIFLNKHFSIKPIKLCPKFKKNIFKLHHLI